MKKFRISILERFHQQQYFNKQQRYNNRRKLILKTIDSLIDSF